jgi:heme exporter protein D
MTGIVEGGWEFVWAAYSVSALTLLGYAFSVHRRYRAERDRHRLQAGRERQSR